VGSPVVTLGPGIHRIPTLGDLINSFVLVADDGQVTLVDCGLRGAPRRVLAGLAALGRQPGDVTTILLTHAHGDHAGGARALVDAGAAEGVDVHEDDAAYVRQGRSAPLAASTLGRLVSRGPTARFDAVPVVRELHDREVLDLAGGLEVLHTPGHTPGHISLLHRSSGVLITGDALFNMRSRISWPWAAACTSSARNRASARVLGEVDYDVAAFTHGPEIRRGARAAVQSFLARSAR
jgi:glyoxylase-like metal-dependent hydrolase (beta-lactamase superfamily II)